MEQKKQIAVLDDDRINNLICKKILTNSMPDAEFLTFIRPSEAQEWLKKMEFFAEKLIFFIDLNMPEMNGWDFLEFLEKNYPSVIACSQIYLLTSSIDLADAEKAANYLYVKAFLTKPLSLDFVENLKNL
jgi:CheY-like chemotaxis protein